MSVIPVQPTQLPSGFCASSYQDLLNTFSAHQFVDISDSTAGGVTVSASKPSDTSRPWLQLDQYGRPVRLYVFAQGAWLSLHTLAPGLTQWWFDVLPDFTAFDGGDANPLSAISGPMWQQAKTADGTLIAAQFPVVAGTLPSTLVLAVGDAGGEEKHILTIPETPPHTHNEQCASPDSDAIGGGGANRRTLGTSASTFIDSGVATTSVGGDGSGAAAGHNTMPPYVVGYLLQRTTRQFFAVT